MNTASADPRPTPPGLHRFWERPVRELVALDAEPLEPALQERHRLYSLLLMSIMASQWNGNKYGNRGDYGRWRDKQALPDVPAGLGLYQGGTYLGHNIGALAVDAQGRVIDYDFNHNDLFNSSVEHAESRLIRRLFALAQIFETWSQEQPRGAALRAGAPQGPAGAAPFLLAVSAPPRSMVERAHGYARRGYSTMLTDVTIYTSLESCAQCSGIMALADLREVAYLQYDQGQYLIGNIMYQATADPSASTSPNVFRAPRPVAGDEFDLAYYGQLNQANRDFAARVETEPFFRDETGAKTSKAITSFLCTDGALEIYRAAGTELDGLDEVRFPDYRRPGRDGQPIPGGLSNGEVLREIKDFLQFARRAGGRGTPHRV